MDMQNVSSLQIPEGIVRTIHDKDNRLLWGRVAYNTKYAGDTIQNGTPTPDIPVPVQTVTGEQTVTITDGGEESREYVVNLGKNLFDVNSITENTGANTNGVEDHEATFYSSNIRAVGLIKVEPNSSYVLSIGDTDVVNRVFIVGMKNATIESGHSFNWKYSGNSIQTGAKDNYILLVLSVVNGQGGTIANTTNANIQLEAGSTVTQYAPYFTPIELCKIGNYQDKVYKSGDDWYVHKECNKYIFSGSEGWSSGASEAASGYYGYYINTQDFLSEYQKSGKDTPVYMSKFAQIPYGYNTQQNGAMTNYTAPYLTVVSINLSTVSALKTSLAGSTYYYVLATPTDTKIIDGALVSQLNAIHEWLTRYGYNATVTGNLPLIVDRTNL